MKHAPAYQILLLVLAAVLGSCGASKGSPSRDPIIGFSMDSLVVERWSRDLQEFLNAASAGGGQVWVEIAGEDAQRQSDQIDSLVRRGIDVLVVVPNDWRVVGPAVRRAKAQGIPVISYDRLVRESSTDLYVTFDNREVGRLMARTLTQAVPTGRYVVIHGAANDDNALQLSGGFYEVLSPLLTVGRIQVVKEIRPEAWKSASVYQELDTFFRSGPQVDGILAGNDMLAEAAIRVLAENRLAGVVKVAGQDADLAACQRIAEGLQYATIYKPVGELARVAAQWALKLARGEKPDLALKVSDGVSEVPYLPLKPRLVTRENLRDTVIADGYHRAEQVYRSSPITPGLSGQ